MMSRVRLSVKIGLSLAAIGWMIVPVSVVAKSLDNRTGIVTTDERLPTINRAAVTPTLLAQAETTKITGVKLTPTDKGIDIAILWERGSANETAAGTIAIPTTSTQDRAVITEIPNALLSLPDGKEFRVENPAAGIANISVTQVSPTSVRVTITGSEGVPTAQIKNNDRGLTITSTPVETIAQTNDEIEINVVGLRNRRGYKLPNATTATRTDTAIKDTPQSIQVIPQQVIKDQQSTRLTEVLKNVPGVTIGPRSPRDPLNIINIRGFNSSFDTLRNGVPDRSIGNVGFGSNIDRVEILKGPASVLFGQGGLGGRVNLVTKQPLRDRAYSVEGSAGSYNSYRAAIDLSDPLNDSKTLLYRLNASIGSNESFVDFNRQQQYLIAPTVSWQIGDKTKLTVEGSYTVAKGPFDFGIPAQGSILPNPNGKIARNRAVSEPNFNDTSNGVLEVGYNLEHRFSDDWQARSVFQTSLFTLRRDLVFSQGLQANLRTLNRGVENFDYDENVYNLDNFVVGKFATGSIKHELVTGFNVSKTDTTIKSFLNSTTPLDVFNPVYGAATPATVLSIDLKNTAQQFGFYVQDQIALTDNLKLLVGGRFDIANQEVKDFDDPTANDFRETQAFSPRVGIVYQPIKPISLYASYSNSFNQATSTFDAALPEPERGTQYEIGVKADLNDRLAATLSFYDLTRSNLSTADPSNPQQTIQVGEQRSQGIEFDISGKIAPGLNVIAGYAYTDARITRDNTLTVGNRLNNVPTHALNLWTTYEIETGNLKGLGFGLGAFFYGDRQATLANTSVLPSYVRTDAAIYYKGENYRAAINIKNLFNTDYFVSAQNANRIIPGDPLTIQGTIAWEF